MTKLSSLSCMAFLLGCNTPPSTSDGVDVEEGACGHALYIVATDYVSSSVAVVDWDGSVLSDAIVDSGSEDAGLSTALSGDVVAPTSLTSGEIALVDRYPNGVLTLLDPKAGKVTKQVSLRTGFYSNPQDFLEVEPGVGFVTRYDANTHPGREAFDEGSDIVVVDLREGRITARIDLSPAMAGAGQGILPRPSRMVRVNDTVFVLLSSYSQSFDSSGEGRLAMIDAKSHAIVGHHVIEGARGCGGLARSDSGNRIAVSCSGTFGGGSNPTLDDSMALMFDVDGNELTEVTRTSAEVLGAPLGFSIAFVGEDRVIAATIGRTDAKGEMTSPAELHEMSIDGASRSVLATKKLPFSLGDVRCGTRCGACFMADADQGLVRRFEIEDGKLGQRTDIALDGVPLAPRFIGGF